jgi:Zn-dependent protease/predicted transcriptional regulator
VTGHPWRLVKIFGIDIRIDPSWLIIATLISYSLFFGLRTVYPSGGTMTTVVISLLGALLFFASVLIHELTHALVARRRGFVTKDITLFLFGGATQANVDSKGPFDEFIVSVVGPLSSFGLAVVFGAARVLVVSVADGELAGILGYLAWANALLGVFNLLPGLPLDGGRVLRSALWKSTGNLETSTRIASIAGEVIGYALMVLGALAFFAGGIFQGIWFAAIGWFLSSSARASYSEMRIRHVLEHVEAAEVMEADPIHIPVGTTIADSVHDYLLRHDHDAFGVDDTGRIIGVVTLESVRKVPRSAWSKSLIEEVMSPVTNETIVDPHASMDTVLNRFEDSAESIAVGSSDHVVGVITRWDLTRWLRRRRALAA